MSRVWVAGALAAYVALSAVCFGLHLSIMHHHLQRQAKTPARQWQARLDSAPQPPDESPAQVQAHPPAAAAPAVLATVQSSLAAQEPPAVTVAPAAAAESAAAGEVGGGTELEPPQKTVSAGWEGARTVTGGEGKQAEHAVAATAAEGPVDASALWLASFRHMSESVESAAALYNLLLAALLVGVVGAKELFLGELSLLEMHKLAERLIGHFSFKLLLLLSLVDVLVVQPVWLLWFAAVTAIKMFGVVGKERSQRLSASPSALLSSHLRTLALLLVVLLSNFLLAVCLLPFFAPWSSASSPSASRNVMSLWPRLSVGLLFAYEPLVIAIDTTQTLLHYCLHLLEAHSDLLSAHLPPALPLTSMLASCEWAELRSWLLFNVSFTADASSTLLTLAHCALVRLIRGFSFSGIDLVLFVNTRTLSAHFSSFPHTPHPPPAMLASCEWAELRSWLLFNVSFTADASSTLLTLAHCALVWLIRGFSFSVIDLVLFFNIRTLLAALSTRVAGFLRWHAALRLLRSTFPDASPAQITAFADDCAICREPLSSAKRLPCGHLFHLSCLRSWLEHGSQAPYSCPTCRRPLDSLPPHVLSSLSPPPQPPSAAAAAPAVGAIRPPQEPAWEAGWNQGGGMRGMGMVMDEDRMAAMVAQVEEVLPHVPLHAIRQELLRRPNVLLAVNALMDAW
ncbi:hypothetical protein CLOM_g8195 [Closterium sp. NIES-68]|nr:hypothetical protein CLOM_g8195 [Closterium sp. NIES-68]